MNLPEEYLDTIRTNHTREEIADMVRRYKDGQPSTEIAGAHGICHMSVLKILRALGVEIRCKGRRKALSESQVKIVREMIRSGEKQSVIALIFSVSISVISVQSKAMRAESLQGLKP